MVIVISLIVILFLVCTFAKNIKKKGFALGMIIAISVVGIVAGVHSYDARMKVSDKFWAMAEEEYGMQPEEIDAVSIITAISRQQDYAETVVMDGETMDVKFVFNDDGSVSVYKYVLLEQ